jgi:hypothetical protein
VRWNQRSKRKRRICKDLEKMVLDRRAWKDVVVDLCLQGVKRRRRENGLGQEGLERCGCRPMPPGGQKVKKREWPRTGKLGKMWL